MFLLYVTDDWVQIEWDSMVAILDSYITGNNPGFPEDWTFFEDMKFMIPFLDQRIYQTASSNSNVVTNVPKDINVQGVSDNKVSTKEKSKNPYDGISKWQCDLSDDSCSDIEDPDLEIDQEMNNSTKDSTDYLSSSTNILSIGHKISTYKTSQGGKRGRKKQEIVKFDLRPSQLKMIAEIKKSSALNGLSSKKMKKEVRQHAFFKIAQKVYNAAHVTKYKDVIGKIENFH